MNQTGNKAATGRTITIRSIAEESAALKTGFVLTRALVDMESGKALPAPAVIGMETSMNATPTPEPVPDLRKRAKHAYRRLFPSRLEQRSAYFQPPLVGWKRRLHAWLDMLFVDHGIIRLVYTNFHQVNAQVYRSSQPLPHQVRRWARLGIKTIVNLRGGRQFGSYPLEVEAAQQAGLTMVDLTLRSRRLLELDELEAFASMLETVETPLVFHCKAGADRASLACALYFLIVENDADTALSQLSLKYGHIKGSKTGILDAMVETYVRDGLPKGLSFMEWARTDYDPAAITAAFKPNLLGSFFGDTVLQRE